VVYCFCFYSAQALLSFLLNSSLTQFCCMITFGMTPLGQRLYFGTKEESNKLCLVRFQVRMAPNMKMTVFWDITRCSLVEGGLYFRGDYCLHHQGNRSHDGGGKQPRNLEQLLREISSSHGGYYEVQIYLLGCTAV
jgi:hypothetical protein